MSNYHYMMRFIIVGDVSVGKSCILKRFESDDFQFTSAPTMGIEFIRKPMTIENNQLMIQVWDTSGEEKMFSMTSSYYKNTCGVILVFDVTRKETFDHLKTWVQKINDHAHQSSRRILIGNKVDLEFQRVISKNEAETFAKQNNLQYLETSAKTSKNVYEAFNLLALNVFNDAKAGKIMVTKDGTYGLKKGDLVGGSIRGRDESELPGTSFQLNQQAPVKQDAKTNCCDKI